MVESIFCEVDVLHRRSVLVGEYRKIVSYPLVTARFSIFGKTRWAVTFASGNAEIGFPPLVRRRFLNVQHGSPCECRNQRFEKILLFPLVGARFLRCAKARWAVTFASRNAEIGFPPLLRRRFLNVQHGSSCECRNLLFSRILLFPFVGRRFLRYANH